ncbi:MAG: hypothetical protein ACLRFP_00530 [Alphaproteobacteria bacterium]
MAIIDFQFPTLTAKGWAVDVHKVLKDGRIFIQQMKFEDKDDAFEYYEHVRKMWQNQKQRGN